ncbi:MAG: penicillin acylase family protein, partial [Actinophytocola sp.]|uniref:penicillin acylase family protein n=1 Tax=Actinophytocola sp. TaxID=1872138 RepID=UPI003C72F08C
VETTALAAMWRFHRDAAAAVRELAPGLATDRLGVPWAAGTTTAVWRALGVATARSHGFAMDLARRRTAGTLHELLGERVLDDDARVRRIGFAFYAGKIVAALPPGQRAVLDAYADGVNALLARATPWEYAVLGAAPRPWTAADSVLVAQDMFAQLTDPASGELRDRLDHLAPGGGDLVDRSPGITTALDGTERGDRSAADLLRRVLAAARAEQAEDTPLRQEPAAGSNSWVAGTELANDIHLALGVPNTLVAAGATIEGTGVRGFLRPGLPVFLAGTTTGVSWGLTRLCGRTGERIPAGAPGTATVVDRDEVLTAGTRTARIRVRLAAAGPVLSDGSVLRWLALEPGGVELGLADLVGCETAEAACEVAAGSGAPPVHLLVTDRHGGSGWTIAGRLVRRGSGSGVVPPGDVPKVIGRRVLVTANCDPAVALPDGRSVAENAYPHHRARRIADLLRAGHSAPAVQSDVDAAFYRPWRTVFLPYFETHPRVAAAVASWDGSADVHARGLHYLVLLHRLVRGKAMAGLAPRTPTAELFGPTSLAALDGELAEIVAEADPATAPAGFRDWPHLLRWAVRAATVYLERRLGPGAPEMPWGSVNRLGLRHPLSPVLPRLHWAIDQPDLPRAGCQQSVDASAAGFGAAMRMVSDPAAGVFRVSWPGGQSGDPLSAGYRAMLPRWLAGGLVDLTSPRRSRR